MLQTKTKEQMHHIIYLLIQDGVHCRSVLNFDSETDWGYKDYNDRIYIDGDVTFDQMAKIVDYLRKECHRKKARWAAMKSEIDGLWVSGYTIFLNGAEKDEVVKFIQSLGEFGYDVDALMEEYNKTGRITI